MRRLLLTLLLVTAGAGSLAAADSHAVSPPVRVIAQTPGGGGWAARESLYPFAHG